MKISKKLIFGGMVAFCLFLFTLIKITYSNFSLDELVNGFIVSIQTSFFIEFFKIISLIFDTTTIIILSLIIAVLLFKKKQKKESYLFAALILINSLFLLILKKIIARPRPLNALVAENTLSFPSGHAGTAVVFFGFLIYLILTKVKSMNLKIVYSSIFVFMVGLIGFARVYLNVHWLSDIIGGFALGLFVLLIGLTIYFSIFLRKKKKF